MLLSPFIPLVDSSHVRRFYCTQWDLVKGVCLQCSSLWFWEGWGYSDRDFQQCCRSWLIIETATYNQFKTLWRASFLFRTSWVDLTFLKKRARDFPLSTTCELLDGLLCFWEKTDLNMFIQQYKITFIIRQLIAREHTNGNTRQCFINVLEWFVLWNTWF